MIAACEWKACGAVHVHETNSLNFLQLCFLCSVLVLKHNGLHGHISQYLWTHLQKSEVLSEHTVSSELSFSIWKRWQYRKRQRYTTIRTYKHTSWQKTNRKRYTNIHTYIHTYIHTSIRGMLANAFKNRWLLTLTLNTVIIKGQPTFAYTTLPISAHTPQPGVL